VVGMDTLFPSRLERRFGAEAGQIGDALTEVDTTALEVSPEDTYRYHAGERWELEGFRHVCGHGCEDCGRDPAQGAIGPQNWRVYHAGTPRFGRHRENKLAIRHRFTAEVPASTFSSRARPSRQRAESPVRDSRPARWCEGTRKRLSDRRRSRSGTQAMASAG